MILLGGVLGAAQLAPRRAARRRRRRAPTQRESRAARLARRSRCASATRVVLVGHGLPFWLGVGDLRRRLDPRCCSAPQRDRRRRAARRCATSPSALADRRSPRAWIITLRVPGRCSWSACPERRSHARCSHGLADLGHAWLGFMNPTSIAAYGLGGALRRHRRSASCPGLSATLVIALLTTLTIKLPANDAILVLICSYVGALYGGSRTAILLNIPGTAANAASCADGYALAQQRRGRPRDRHRHLGRVHRHAVRRALPGAVHAVAGRGRARSSAPSSSSGWRCSASRMSGIDRRRRPAQGLADGRCSACSSRRSARKASTPTTASPSAGTSSPAASR